MDYNHTMKRMFDARPKGKVGTGRREMRLGRIVWTRISDF
jgi:hypothetical protein